MRVLWASHRGGLGGAELALAEGVEALGSRGHELHVLLPADGALRQRVEAAACVHVEYSAWWMGHGVPRSDRCRRTAVNLLRARRRVADLARAISAEVVVTNTLTIPAPALAARTAGLPHAWFVHEFGDRDHGLGFHWGRRFTLSVVNALSDVVLVNSEAVEAHFARWIPERKLSLARYAVTVPAAPEPHADASVVEERTDASVPERRTGVSVPAGRGQVSGRSPFLAEEGAAPRLGRGAGFTVLLLGRRSPRKGTEDAVRAVARLIRSGAPVALELVGEGSPLYDERLRGLIRALGVEGTVRLVDFDPNPHARLARADVALMCSPMEAFGRVTVEAMKLGVPVIGAAAGGTRELVEHGRTGLLYEAGDADGLADRIDWLRRRPDEARNLADRARAWARRTFTAERYGAALEEALAGAVRRRASGRTR